jgi:hypothetical protein
MTAQSAMTFKDAGKDHIFWGRIVESAVGAYLLNSIRGTQMDLFYWREGDKEVDFVLRHGSSIIAIEVKSNQKPIGRTVIDFFVSKFKPAKVLLIGEQGISLEDFLKAPLSDFTS